MPYPFRHRQLQGFYRALLERVHPNDDNAARQVALEIELETVKVARSKAMYSNNSALKIVQIRRARMACPKFMPKHDLTKLTVGSKKSINQILADPKLAQSVLKIQKPKILRLTGVKLHAALSEYVLTVEQMKINNYPLPSTESKKIVTIHDMLRYVRDIYYSCVNDYTDKVVVAILTV